MTEEDERHFIELTLRRRRDDAEVAVGKELAADDARRASKPDGSGVADSLRWWMHVSAIADTHARKFIVEAAAAVAGIGTTAEAYRAFHMAAEEFLDFLGEEYERRYRNNRHWYSPHDAKTAPLPPYWQEARSGLELDLELQRRHFVGSAAQDDKVAVLVPTARPAIRRDKEHADKAAELIRSGAVTGLAAAIKEVVYPDPHRQPASVERGIRACFDLHYSPAGERLV